MIYCRSGRIANEPWNGSESFGPIFRTKETTIDIAFFLFLFIRVAHMGKENFLTFPACFLNPNTIFQFEM